MLRKLLCASALALLGTGASAASIGFSLTISNILDTNNSVTNVPQMALTNTGTFGEIERFSFTIGNVAYNYDAVYFFSDATNMTLAQGDTNDGNQSGNTVRVNEGIIDFTNFGSGVSYDWRVDVDIDNANTIEDYRTVLFNNGGAANAVFTAFFTGGRQLSVTSTDSEAVGAISYTFSDAAPVPLPAGLPLVLGGVGALALMRKRAQRRA